MKRDNKPILEFVAIKRRDCGEWAIPGVSIKLKTYVTVPKNMGPLGNRAEVNDLKHTVIWEIFQVKYFSWVALTHEN